MAGSVRPFAVRRWIVLALLCVALVASDAQAQVDMSGPWRVDTYFVSVSASDIWTYSQSGTHLTAVGTGAFGVRWTGTIDPQTGSFTLLTPSNTTPPCPHNVITAVVNASGTANACTVGECPDLQRLWSAMHAAPTGRV